LEKSVVEGDVDSVPSFSTSELRDLFKLRENTICGRIVLLYLFFVFIFLVSIYKNKKNKHIDTHDLLNCRCTLLLNKQPAHKRQSLKVDELIYWQHADSMTKIKDPILKIAGEGIASFVFFKETQGKKNDSIKKWKMEIIKPNRFLVFLNTFCIFSYFFFFFGFF
jgi:hypothetical protein